jgi:hypothetical protein
LSRVRNKKEWLCFKVLHFLTQVEALRVSTLVQGILQNVKTVSTQQQLIPNQNTPEGLIHDEEA